MIGRPAAHQAGVTLPGAGQGRCQRLRRHMHARAGRPAMHRAPLL